MGSALKVLVVDGGRMGTSYARAYRTIGEFNIVGLVDRDRGRAEAVNAVLERMTAGFRAAGVKEVAIPDHLRATQHNDLYEESEGKMRAVAQRAGLTILQARAPLDASPDVARFLTLDGIHMAEPYHRLMAKVWLRGLADGGTTLWSANRTENCMKGKR